MSRTLAVCLTLGTLGAIAGSVALRGDGPQATQTYQTSPVPRPALDVLKVEGQVSVVNTPTVRAQQDGSWTVTIPPESRLAPAPLSFLLPDTAYVLNWPDGTNQTVTVLEVRDGAWVLAQQGDGPREWMNLALVRTIRTVASP